MTKVERHYSPQQAKDVLGVAHVNEIYLMIKSGKLVARKRVLRGHGTRPRLIIPESELRKVIDAMPTTADEPVTQTTPQRPAPAANRADAPVDPPRPRGRRRGGGTASRDWV